MSVTSVGKKRNPNLYSLTVTMKKEKHWINKQFEQQRALAAEELLLRRFMEKGSVGMMMMHVRNEREKYAEVLVKEAIVAQKEISESLAKTKFKKLIEELFILKEKQHKPNLEASDYTRGRKAGEVQGFNAMVRFMQNRIDKLLFLLDK